jgi:hypothetical protein
MAPEDNELLQQFMDGELNAEDGATVQHRLETEPQLRASFDRLRLAQTALHFQGLSEQVGRARARYEAARQQPATIRRIKWARVSMAAAAVVLLVVAGLWLMRSEPLSGDQLYAAHFLEYKIENSRGTAGGSPGIDSGYAAGNFSWVAETFRERSRLNGRFKFTTPRDQFLAGLSAMHLKQWDDAAMLFSGLQGSPYRQDADYYRALVFIQLKKYADAEQLLKVIVADPDHLYYRNVTPEFISQVSRLKQGS